MIELENLHTCNKSNEMVKKADTTTDLVIFF